MDTINNNSAAPETAATEILNPIDELRKGQSFDVIEAYKTVRMNISFMLSQQEKKSFVVSSYEASDGKSTSSINIAAAFSQLGSRVLLIDADLRKPTVHKKLKIANTKGLTSVLVGFCSAEEAIQSVGNNLDVLTCGPIPPNPSELLSSAAMDILLNGLGERYDYIVCDTPPIGLVSDASVLAPKTAGLVLIAKAHSTTIDTLKKTKLLTDTYGIKTLGVIVNGVRSANRAYKYYRKYYRYGYAYKEQSKKSDKK